MKKNHLLLFSFLLLVKASLFSQEVQISKDIAESEFKIVGFWNNKLITYSIYSTLELRIVDTTSVDSKAKTVKIGPNVEQSKRTAAITCFIHDDFMYEVYYVFTLINTTSAQGYNVIVKRDLNTMKIVNQQIIDHLDTQVKFVKTTENGFYLCFGYSYVSVYGGFDFTTRNNYNKVIPTLIKGFDYDLEPLLLINLNEYDLRADSYLNGISFDENSNLTIPIAQRGFLDEEEGDRKKENVVFIFANLSGDLLKTKLDFDLDEELNVSSASIRFDEATKRHKGVFIINGSPETMDDHNLKFGYMYMEWSESGKLLFSKFVSLQRDDVITPEIKTYAESEKFDLSKVLRFNLDSNSSFFSFLDDGSMLYAVSNISTANFKEITNSKFILCISKEGSIKWSLTIPYSSNQLYENAFFFLERNQLHLYTKEFTNNFLTGSYQYRDSRLPANGESVVMTDRVIDVNSGSIVSHKPIIEQRSKSFEPIWPIHVTAMHEYLIRYRNPKGNKDRWVKVKY